MADITCSVPDCDRRVYCKGWCEPHYRQWRTHGVVGGPIRQRINGTPEQRFWPRVDKHGPLPSHRPDLGPCWLWTTTASTTNGYPQFRHGRRMVLAYRFAYETIVGPIPDGLQLDHLCHNQSGCEGGPDCLHRKCVNPGHLEPVTNDENAARRAGMHYAPMCRAGLHKMIENNVRITDIGLRICRTCVPGRRANFEEVCVNGHQRTPENVVYFGMNRQCRPCRRDAQRRHRQHQKLNAG